MFNGNVFPRTSASKQKNVLENVPEKLKREILELLKDKPYMTMSDLAKRYVADIKTIIMKSYVITGGVGFIGSHVVRLFVKMDICDFDAFYKTQNV